MRDCEGNLIVAPKGKFVVAVEDPFSQETCLCYEIDDVDEETALAFAEKKNAGRNPLDCMHWVIDDKGETVNFGNVHR